MPPLKPQVFGLALGYEHNSEHGRLPDDSLSALAVGSGHIRDECRARGHPLAASTTFKRLAL